MLQHKCLTVALARAALFTLTHPPMVFFANNDNQKSLLIFRKKIKLEFYVNNVIDCKVSKLAFKSECSVILDISIFVILFREMTCLFIMVNTIHVADCFLAKNIQRK